MEQNQLTQHPVQLWIGPSVAVQDRLWHEMASLWCTAETGRPCQRCESCRAMHERTHSAVTWVTPDGATYTRDAVDRIMSTVRTTPVDDHMYVVVIEHAELLQATSGNALLKVCEEPPDGWHFVLMTERPALMLPTLRSRCYELYVYGQPFVKAAVREGVNFFLMRHQADLAAFDAWLQGATLFHDDVRAISELLIERGVEGVPAYALCAYYKQIDEFLQLGVNPKYILQWLMSALCQN